MYNFIGENWLPCSKFFRGYNWPRSYYILRSTENLVFVFVSFSLKYNPARKLAKRKKMASLMASSATV